MNTTRAPMAATPTTGRADTQRNDLIARLAYLYGCDARLFRPMAIEVLERAFVIVTSARPRANPPAR